MYQNLVISSGQLILSSDKNLCLERGDDEKNNLVLPEEEPGVIGPNLVVGPGSWRNLVVEPFALPLLIQNRVIQNNATPPSLVDGQVHRRGAHYQEGISKTYRQTYRVADDSLERWELYLGEDEMPDFDDSSQPVATSLTLPFSFSPSLPDSGDTVQLYLVVRKRNRFDLLSHNQHPTIVEIDSVGDEELGELSNPEIIRVIDGVSGEIIVFARYPYGVDRNEADTWELYVEEGVDPDPDLDEPVATEVFGLPTADYLWRVKADGLTPGSTYHVMAVVVRASESGDGERGESSVVQIALAESYDIDADEATLFGGQEHEIGT